MCIHRKFCGFDKWGSSSSFIAIHGLRQWCPLSPLLFLLIVEGLSLLIHRDKRLGMIKGLKLSSMLSITHNLFVDDVVMFGYASFSEWRHFIFIIDLCAADSGMTIS